MHFIFDENSLVQGPVSLHLAFFPHICIQIFALNMTCEDIQRAVEEYMKFLAIAAAYPDLAIAPTLEMDLAWHAHQVTDPPGFLFLDAIFRNCPLNRRVTGSSVGLCSRH